MCNRVRNKCPTPKTSVWDVKFSQRWPHRWRYCGHSNAYVLVKHISLPPQKSQNVFLPNYIYSPSTFYSILFGCGKPFVNIPSPHSFLWYEGPGNITCKENTTFFCATWRTSWLLLLVPHWNYGNEHTQGLPEHSHKQATLFLMFCWPRIFV